MSKSVDLPFLFPTFFLQSLLEDLAAPPPDPQSLVYINHSRLMRRMSELGISTRKRVQVISDGAYKGAYSLKTRQIFIDPLRIIATDEEATVDEVNRSLRLILIHEVRHAQQDERGVMSGFKALLGLGRLVLAITWLAGLAVAWFGWGWFLIVEPIWFRAPIVGVTAFGAALLTSFLLSKIHYAVYWTMPYEVDARRFARRFECDPAWSGIIRLTLEGERYVERWRPEASGSILAHPAMAPVLRLLLRLLCPAATRLTSQPAKK